MPTTTSFMYATVGDYVRLSRALLNIGQKEIALAIGFDSQTIANVEHDRLNSSFLTVMKVVRFLEQKGAPLFDFHRVDVGEQRENDEHEDIKRDEDHQPLTD